MLSKCHNYQWIGCFYDCCNQSLVTPGQLLLCSNHCKLLYAYYKFLIYIKLHFMKFINYKCLFYLCSYTQTNIVNCIRLYTWNQSNLHKKSWRTKSISDQNCVSRLFSSGVNCIKTSGCFNLNCEDHSAEVFCHSLTTQISDQVSTSAEDGLHSWVWNIQKL